ncbi:tetratricopeptide repeat protein [Limisphaera sp. 4302-co]|uniref:tetratricopeptide repeat protein n=1 Tax=Limisphaera sp. 4302-co TaxID=3400417 RepID=UPI003C186633
MSNLLVILLTALLSSNAPPAELALPAASPARTVAAPDPADPVEQEYRRLLELDDRMLGELDQLIRDFQNAGSDNEAARAELRRRIKARIGEVREAYEAFLRKHPDHARARLAYGSFLNEIKDEEGAVVQWEKARQLDPTNPAAWNNLANYYGHRGPVTNAFRYYQRAIELDPREPVYYHNFGTTVYLFRKDAMEYFGITEQQVFDKALDLYARALQLDPTNFFLAHDIAQTYYGIRPLRTNEALLAWTYTLGLARDAIERQGVLIHMARIRILAGQFDQARALLEKVTEPALADLKARVERNLREREARARGSREDSPSGPAP